MADITLDELRDYWKTVADTSERDKRGLNANKPAASAVPAGTTYWSVDTDPNGDSIEVAVGTDWVVME